MRTPVPQTPADPRELVDAIAESLADVLVAEWKARHSQQDPAGPNHEGINGGGER